MAFIDARDIPADPVSAERLAAGDLDYRIVDMADAADGDRFLRADARGFLDEEPTEEAVAHMRETMVERRNIGVFEKDAGDGAWPIATVSSWVAPLTVPGGEVGMWAISSVTVAGTHRRRGIARALLEGELRAAASAGAPVAGLTASEATIYGRYGFAPAVPVARITVDTRRAGWAGPVVPGRVEYVDRETLAAELGAVHAQTRGQRSGQIDGWPGRWQRFAGLAAGDKAAASVRGVHYRDADGTVRGAMAYTLQEIQGTFRFELSVRHLGAATADALSALWGFAVHHDLVNTVTADLRPVDDPIVWLVQDQRAVEVVVHDHGWLRIIDVPAALQARTYRGPVELTLRVEDPLGIAGGTWRFAVDGQGRATVSNAEPSEADAVLDVVALSAIYAGGVSAVQLHTAGRLDATSAVAASIDDAFRVVPAPHLAIWY